MEQNISFRFTAPDPDRLRPQVSRALEKRSELLSRRKYPRLWNLTDRLNRVEKAPPSVLRRRRKLHTALGMIDWGLAVFLLLPGLMDPAALTVPLLVGAVCFGTSMGVLWRNARRVLGVLSALLGTVLCLGGLCSLAELGRFLPLGLLCGAVAFAALRPRKPARVSAFDRAAEHLLRRNAAIPSVESVCAVFSDTGMSIGPEPPGEAVRSIPYSDFELVLETRDLILPVCDGSMVVLQKKDLLTGTLSRLRELLGEQVLYIRISEQEEPPS